MHTLLWKRNNRLAKLHFGKFDDPRKKESYYKMHVPQKIVDNLLNHLNNKN